VPQHEVKDFNIVTNHYVKDHKAKSKRDSRYAILEAVDKDAQLNRYNPVTQQFNDPHNEEVQRTCDDAHGVELNMRAEQQLPPSFKGRETAHYNMVSHEKGNTGMLDFYDEAEAGRKDRYNNRYIMEHNWHAQDIKGDHINNTRKLNRTAHERFEGETSRGFDILSNKSYGNGAKHKTLYAPFSQPKPSPWQQATSGLGRSASMSATVPGRFSDTDGTRSDAGRSRRSCSAHGAPTRSPYAGRAG